MKAWAHRSSGVVEEHFDAPISLLQDPSAKIIASRVPLWRRVELTMAREAATVDLVPHPQEKSKVRSAESGTIAQLLRTIDLLIPPWKDL